MSSTGISAIVFCILFGSALSGVLLRKYLPGHHLSSEAKDTVKVAMGLVSTMTALVLGLLVAAAKGSYDTQRAEVIQLAAKTAFLDRVLEIYGTEAAESRGHLRKTLASAEERLWAASGSSEDPAVGPGKALYESLQSLVPKTDTQRALRAQAASQVTDLGQLRWLLYEQSGSSISRPLLIVVISWLAFIFLSFGLFAPNNAVTLVSLLIAAVSVAGSIFLIFELDRPFNGFIQIPPEILHRALRPM
ncbi:MAG: hypothetical protein JNL10_19820 [Verrucomicrobiales bacterium]|nr:hypothetical protein [Verrucomicrobiales bacterium]